VPRDLDELIVDEQKLLLSLLKTVSGSWIAPSQFERLASELAIPDGAATIYFLTGIKHILRELPFKVYTDDAARLAVLDAVQTALDAAIEREEAATGESNSNELG
jgi:type III secretion protein W